jgi:hypothetical protein
VRFVNLMGDPIMLHAKQASKQKRRIKVAPVLGAAGLSLSLASGAPAATSGCPQRIC